jgi:protein TonB
VAAARIRIVMPRVPGFDSPVAPFVFVSLAGHVLFVIAWTLAPMLKPPPTFPKNAIAVSLVAAAPARQRAAAPVRATPPPSRKAKEGMRVEDLPVNKPKPLPKKDTPKKAEPKPPKPAPKPVNSAPAGAQDATDSESDDNAGAASGPTGPEGAESTGVSVAGGGDVRFDWYRSAVTAALHSKWRRPVVQRQVDAYEVVVTFDIQRNGNVSNLQLAQSSGVSVLDRSAMGAVLDAQPLPPLPPAWSDAVLPATYVFRLYPE